MTPSILAGASALALIAYAPSALAQTDGPPPEPGRIATRRAELLRERAAIQLELDALDSAVGAGASSPSVSSGSRAGRALAREVVVTAAPSPASQSPTGQAVVSVGRGLFKHQPDRNIAEVLDLVPGVSVIQGNGPRDVSVSIRGSNDRQAYGVRNVQVFEDGFPLTQPDGTARMDLTDPHAYGAIDVFEGPSSALFGNYATGGAIDFHTRPGGDIDGVEVGADFGAFGYYNDYATIGGKGERYEYAGFLSNVRAEGSTANSQYDTVTANVLATYALTSRDRVTFKFIDNELDADLPIRLSLNQFRLNPYQRGCAVLQSVGCASVSLFDNGFTGARTPESAEAAGLGRHDRRTIVGARYEHDLDGQTTWRTTATFDDRDIDQPTSSSSYRGPYPSFNVISDLTRRGILFGLGSSTLVDAYANYEDINAFVYNVMPGGGANLGGLTQTVFGHQLNVGARGREELTLTPRLTGVVGLDVEYTELGAEEANDTYSANAASVQTKISAHRTFVDVAPEASLQWRPKEGWTLHARVATGFGTPQATNLFTTPQGTFGNNTALQPQTNVGLDLGAEWRPSPTERLFLTAFYEWFSDELVTQSAGVNLQSYTFNAPHSEHRGVELGLDWRPAPDALPGARLYLAYLYDNQIYTRYVEQLSSAALTRSFDRDGNAIPGVTPNFGDARVIYDQPSGALEGLGGFLEALGRDGYDLDNANLLKAPGYLLVNVELHYDAPPGRGALSCLRLYVEVQNLLDQTYVGSASNITDSLNAGGGQNGANVLASATGSIYAGAPRSVFGGVRVKF